MSRRLAAIVAILGGAVAIGLAAYAFVTDFPRGLIVFACVLGALAAAWGRPAPTRLWTARAPLARSTQRTIMVVMSTRGERGA
jgi:hypothetical protein